VKELKEIIKSYDAVAKAGKNAALASVVHLDGSSYRRPGARMLVTDNGEMTGAISGGCLEGDALRKAMLVLSQNQNKLVTYDTSDEDDATIGVQLGCAGVIQVLFEPVHQEKKDNPVQLLRKAIAIRRPAVLVTLFFLQDKRREQPGTCLLMEADGSITGEIPFPVLDEMIMNEVHEVLINQQSSFKQYGVNNEEVTAFIEFLQPTVSLVIVGAGNDAVPVMQIADTLGWEVRVVDGRSTHAKQERFLSACQVLVSKPEKVLEQIPVDPFTVFVMMTHNYNYDRAMLEALLQRKEKYIGLLGPKKKLERMISEMRDEGIQISEEQLQNVYGPVGLDIGAETPEEIALSIVAEIKAILSGASGSSLRNKEEGIHSREATSIEIKRPV
jgi:xanthine dehydrogenase accessory factor